MSVSWFNAQKRKPRCKSLQVFQKCCVWSPLPDSGSLNWKSTSSPPLFVKFLLGPRHAELQILSPFLHWKGGAVITTCSPRGLGQSHCCPPSRPPKTAELELLQVCEYPLEFTPMNVFVKMKNAYMMEKIECTSPNMQKISVWNHWGQHHLFFFSFCFFSVCCSRQGFTV